MNGELGYTVYYPSTMVVDMRGIGREESADNDHVCTLSLKSISLVTIRKYIPGCMNHSSWGHRKSLCSSDIFEKQKYIPSQNYLGFSWSMCSVITVTACVSAAVHHSLSRLRWLPAIWILLENVWKLWKKNPKKTQTSESDAKSKNFFPMWMDIADTGQRLKFFC